MSPAVPAYDLFERYSGVIAGLPPGPVTVWKHRELELQAWEERGHRMVMSYAPFDHVNRSARVVLLGITPGHYQAAVALAQARDGLRSGKPPNEILAEAKRAASFAGPTRPNLISMLDAIDVPAGLDIPSAASLFSDASELVHCTSALRYPIGRDATNYTGSAPPMLESPPLRSMVEDTLAGELEQVVDALVIPLGVQATRAVAHLCGRNALDGSRVLAGFPHPSGANGSRVETLRRNRDTLTARARKWLGRQATPTNDHKQRTAR